MDRSRDPLRSQPFTPTTLQHASRSRSDQPRNNYAPSSRIPRPGPEPSGTQPSFPPHPSIRPPANVKASPRMPMGVGVAPRPTRNAPAAYQQDSIAKLPSEATTPKSAWDLSQESSHAQAAMHTPPPVPPQPPMTTRRYNMTQSYVSSIHEDTPPLRQHMPPRESHYPEDDSPRPAYPSSKFMPQFEFPLPNNRTTMDTVDSYEHFSPQPAKPRMIDTKSRPSMGPKLGEISPASTRANAMNALSQAIAVGISKPVSPVTSRAPSPGMRMPFDNDQTSVHTLDLEPPDLRDAPPVPKSRLPAPEVSTSPKSANSESPILGLGIGAPARGLSTKRDVTKRPPRLDIDAVREMEARGSTTSLTDLIKRATKLASNLDRGKTASRLGMLDMFGGSSQRLGNLPPGKRDSSMSDMLSSFPAPAAGTPRSEWPTNEKGFMSSTAELSRGKGDGSSSKRTKSGRRRICGMTIPCFTVVLIALILLIAAAVLIPIFLIVVPRQNNNNNSASAASVSACENSDSSRCQNEGYSILTNGACGCVCRSGFTGRNCETEGDSTCTTQDIADGETIYRQATMSRDVLRGFTDAGTFNIPLNATTILGLFSNNAITCADASTLVDVSTSNDTSTNDKRAASPQPLVMIPGLEPSEVMNALHLPHITQAPTPTTLYKRQGGPVTDSSLQTMISQRTDLTFDPSVNSFVTITPSATGSAPSSSSTSSSNEASPPNIAQQLAFSRVVVLYIAEKSQSIAVALDTKARLARYFDNFSEENVVDVGQVAGQTMMVDMVRFTIAGAGRTVGGGGSGN